MEFPRITRRNDNGEDKQFYRHVHNVCARKTILHASTFKSYPVHSMHGGEHGVRQMIGENCADAVTKIVLN